MELEALLAARPSRRDELGAWYSQLLEEAERAGKSVPELAGRVGCAPETIYSWRRRLTAKRAGRPRAVPNLVRVQVAEPKGQAGGDRLEVVTRTGRSVFVPGAFDPSTLATVIAVLERC